MCPNTLLPHKKPAGGQLAAEQKQENRILSPDRILVENFFGRWKMIFGICHEVYRGELRMLGKIVLVTIAMTN
jgi:transposase